MTKQPRTLDLAAVLFSRSRGDVAPFLPLAAVLPTMAGTNRHRLGTIRMQISAERRVAARREAVWAALNDLDTLCDCIPGCLKLQRLDDNVIAAEVRAKVGPVATRFQIDAAARKMADAFFERLAMRLAPEETVTMMDEPKRVGLRPRFWVPLLIASVLLMLYAFSKL